MPQHLIVPGAVQPQRALIMSDDEDLLLALADECLLDEQARASPSAADEVPPTPPPATERRTSPPVVQRPQELAAPLAAKRARGSVGAAASERVGAGDHVEKHSGLRVSNRVVGSAGVDALLAGRKVVPLSQLARSHASLSESSVR